MNKEIGSFCKEFRMNVLNMTLEEISEGTNIKTISSFEHGYSTNMKHLELYINKCETTELLNEFIKGINDILRKGRR